MKKILSIALVVVILGSITAFAVGPNENGVGLGNGNGFGPNQFNFSEALMEEFDITQAEYDAAREEGKTLKDLVDDEDFYDVMLAQHELRLGEMVEAGRITQEQAQEALGKLEADFADGTCSGVGMNIGENYGQRNQSEGFGQQNGARGNGQAGAGQGAGGQRGNGLRDQSCITE
ncbi:MAG: hypothetical protein SCJ93_09135 [Bacillota bacterium]|nr:hypothetical protein [Bacillota bacterium]